MNSDIDNNEMDNTRSFITISRGTIISHYKVIEKIGSGGMGEVYLAEDTELDRKVALKFLPPQLRQDDDCRKRFKREAQAAAKLSHPNIVTIHEVGEYQGGPFFVMEYVEGKSLREVVAEERDIDRIIEIAIQLCDGLHSAHTAGVTHRDIKPSNIIIDSSGRPRLLDFGLAKVKGAENLTRNGSTLGTVGYMSPEQIEGKMTDARSDLFSLGVVLYELIAGCSPFRREDEVSTFKAILQDTPEPLVRYKSCVPDALQQIVFKLLEKNPALRYQSADGVLPDLRQLTSQEHKAVTSRPKSIQRRMLTPVIIVTMTIVIVLILKPWKFEITSDDPAQASIRRLAVLYLANRGVDDDEYLSYGITEDLIVDLTRIGTMGVAPMPSILKYKDSDEDLDKIAEHLQVNLLLNGSIHKTDDNIRVSAQLIDVESGLNLWADRWEESFENLPHIKESLAKGISQALEIDTMIMQASQVGTPDAGNPVAYDHYLRGKYTFEHKSDDADVEVALGLYRKALELEPSLLAARRGVASVLLLRGQYDEANKELQLALEEARQRNLRSDESAALRKLADVYRRQSLFDEAREYSMRALEISRELGDQSGIASGLNRIGIIYERQGDYAKALQSCEQSLEIKTRLGDQRGMSASMIGIGNIYWCQGDYAKALQSYEQSLEIETRLGDQRGMSASMIGIGNIYWCQGDYAKALQSYEQSLEIYSRLGDQRGMAESLLGIGNIYWHQGNYAKTLQIYEQSLEIYSRLGDHRGMAESLLGIGNIYRKQGDYTQALQSFEQSLEIKTRLGDQRGMASGLLGIGNIYRNQGDYAKALQYFHKSVEISNQIGNRHYSAHGSVNLGELYYFLGDPDSSRKYLEQGLAIAENISADDPQLLASGYLAALMARRGDFDSGLEQLQDLAEEAREQGYPVYEVTMERLFGEVLTEYGSSDADRQKGRATLHHALSLAEERGIPHEIRWIKELLKEGDY